MARDTNRAHDNLRVRSKGSRRAGLSLPLLWGVLLFYVRGNFGSRRGIEPASITLHPRGIPHGPHPGTIMASKNALRTEELAVMFDTQHTLELTEQAVALDDEKYPQSWLD